MPPQTNRNLQYVTISDFSPGVVRSGYSSTFPITYTPNAPLGSAASAYRCINKPGIGLVPFYPYAASGIPLQSPPAGTVYNVGMATLGPVLGLNNTQYNYAQSPFTEHVFYVSLANNAGTWTSQLAGAIVNNAQTGWNVITMPGWVATTTSNNPFGASLATTQWFNMTSTTAVVPVLLVGQATLNGQNGTDVYVTPGWQAAKPPATAAAQYQTITSSFGITYQLGTHQGRFFFINNSFQNDPNSTGYNPTYGSGGNLIGGAETFAVSNQIQGQGINALQGATALSSLPETFAPELTSGLGAWGSVSTGELLLIKNAGGAVIVNGDPYAPSSAIKLPAVQGVGNMLQKAVSCSSGLVYVTENDGVYMWNGGNTSTKISQNIPDDACVRSELTGFSGVRCWNEVWMNLVFFANNWIYDSINNNWWQAEDPTVINMGQFAKQTYGDRYLYAMQGGAGPTNPLQVYRYDARNRATSWAWTSNPIPVTQNNLVTMRRVDIVASNSTATACTITVTPTSASGVGGTNQGGSGSALSFTIPANAVAVRLGAEFGYTAYNIQLAVTATNTNSSNMGPVLHQIVVGYAASNPTVSV